MGGSVGCAGVVIDGKGDTRMSSLRRRCRSVVTHWTALCVGLAAVAEVITRL